MLGPLFDVLCVGLVAREALWWLEDDSLTLQTSDPARTLSQRAMLRRRADQCREHATAMRMLSAVACTAAARGDTEALRIAAGFATETLHRVGALSGASVPGEDGLDSRLHARLTEEACQTTLRLLDEGSSVGARAELLRANTFAALRDELAGRFVTEDDAARSKWIIAHTLSAVSLDRETRSLTAAGVAPTPFARIVEVGTAMSRLLSPDADPRGRRAVREFAPFAIFAEAMCLFGIGPDVGQGSLCDAVGHFERRIKDFPACPDSPVVADLIAYAEPIARLALRELGHDPAKITAADRARQSRERAKVKRGKEKARDARKKIAAVCLPGRTECTLGEPTSKRPRAA